MTFNVFIHIETKNGVWNDIYQVKAKDESHAQFVAVGRVLKELDGVISAECLEVSKV